MRAALYYRVSSESQTTENQVPDVEALARQRGVEIVEVYSETGSAVKHRPAHKRLMADAHRGRFDVLIVWSLDRLGRSMVGVMNDIVALDGAGVSVLSCREPWLSLEGPARGLLVAVFGWCAQQERERLIERTRAGVDRARRQGKLIGRKPTHINIERAQRLRDEGHSIREIATILGVSKSIVGRTLSQKCHPASAA